MNPYRRSLLLAEQGGLTSAIMLCEGIVARKDRTLTRGAKECAEALTKFRNKVSEKSGLRREMGWSKR